MSRSKAFVDTTILADILTKTGRERREAKSALANYEITELPVYAIKEFKGGVLDYIKYLYNILLESETVGQVMLRLTSNYRQKNRRDTAFRLLGELTHEAELLKTTELQKKLYGDLASDKNILYAKVKYETKMLLYKAWNNRRSITTNVVEPLHCYEEIAPYEEKNGELSLKPKECKTNECCLTKILRETKRFDLTKLKVAIDNLPSDLKNKDENKKRREILRKIGSNPKYKISESDCRNLGDAVFALLCPQDAHILTTNIKDHEPLAKALGKTAVSPNQILEKISIKKESEE